MKKTLLMLIVLGLAVMTLPGCGGDKDSKTGKGGDAAPVLATNDAKAEKMIALMGELNEVLASATDRASAEAAAPRAIELLEEIDVLGDELDAITEAMPEEESEAFMAKYEEPMMEAFGGFMGELMRIGMEQDLAEPLAGVFEAMEN
jgi:hypothetical protein